MDLLFGPSGLTRRDFLRGVAVAGLGLSGAAGLIARPAASHPDVPTGLNALEHREYDNLGVFTDWLARNNARGYIGEMNWPNNLRRPEGTPGTFDDELRWNTLGERWYRWADAAGLWVTMWCVDERQRHDGFWLTTYASVGDAETRPISEPRAQAQIYEAHGSAPGYLRGMNVSSAEGWDKTRMSNADRGVYDVDYWYASQATFDYLKSKGTDLVRLPFRWERVQPALGQNLEPNELARLKACVSRAGAAGLRVVLDVHNYAGYYFSVYDSLLKREVPKEHKLGSTALPPARFYDLWRRLSTEFKSNTTVLAYGLMNEPVGMETPSGFATPQQAWQAYSQRALDAIRANNDTKLVMVPGYFWSMARTWTQYHPRKWITDPANRHRYEAHHYFDEGSGYYERSYDQAVAHWRGQGF